MKILPTSLFLTANRVFTLSTLRQRLLIFANKQEELFKSIAVGLLVALSILFIKPFGIRYLSSDNFLQLLILTYSTIASVLVFFNEKFTKRLLIETFKVEFNHYLNLIIWNAFLSASIFIVCLLFFLTLLEINSLFIIIGLKLAFFFLLPILVFISFFVKNSKENGNPILHLKSMNKKEFFSVREKNLYFIECEDNYAAIHYLNHITNNLEKRLIRSSLTKLNEQLSTHSFQRCHRSFIVNVKQIEVIKGSKKNQKIFLKNSSRVIPISRKYNLNFTNLENKLN